MAKGKKPMDVDASTEMNGHTPPSNEKALVAVPVGGCSSGEGLPYAPEGWPNPGDIWKWRVGNRKTVSGHWVDRILYAPRRLQQPAFHSKLSVEQYIRKEFPDADVDKFFASFIWRIPAGDFAPKRDVSETISGAEDCKVGNKTCTQRTKEKTNTVVAKACDICCSERSFCRDCCCILCCKTIDWACESYNSIRCEASVDDKFICGHVAHLDCALRCHMAGTVGGSIGLDVGYYCRRCDNRTELIEHVTKLFKHCESVDSRKDIKKMLNLGLCILGNSEQATAKNLRHRLEQVLAKLKHGVGLEQIWKVDVSMSACTAGEQTPESGNEIMMFGAVDIRRNTQVIDPADGVQSLGDSTAVDARAQVPVYITADHSNISTKFEDDVDKVLQELKKSQESEYQLAEQKLYAQKDLLLSLYQQLDGERSELANNKSLNDGSNSDSLLNSVLTRVDQIKHEEVKLYDMMKIARGFGQTSKIILNEYFGLMSDNKPV